ncbi:aspartate aminotransferase [Oceanotoga teriensis]|uniref:aspartate aminotransferase n=1 Tax=Oceanotoga teriensis TaxID=515440 RepID=UPI002712BD8C|nr:aspartate aminotransferase [Oceanotoga teriensis]MDO7975490.1 pyridoxal phosphate-dependent aminotransferase [Oceanotoga teriensis]
MLFSEKILSVEPSITLELNAKAIELSKKGYDIVKLTAGEPDFSTPTEIIEAAYEAMKNGKTKYTDSKGIIELREKIVEYVEKRTNLKYGTDEVVVTNGGKQSLYNILLAMINPGDEIMVLDPSWVSYEAQIKMVGGVPVHVPLDEEEGFLPTESKLNRYYSPKTKAILINSPNNPTGVVYPKETLEIIANFAKDKEIFVISDEVYELLIYEGNHISIATIEDMKERTIIVNAFSKTWAMTGWRIGYCLGPKKLMKQIAKIQSHSTSNVNTPTQYAAIKAFDVDVYYMFKKFKDRRDYVASRLEKMNLKFLKPKGAFYYFINISEFGIEDSEFSKKLLDEAMLAVVPGSGFYKKGYIRISFATSDENLEKALDRLEKFVKKLREKK